MSKLFKSGGSGFKLLRAYQEKIESLVNQGLHSYGNRNTKKSKKVKKVKTLLTNEQRNKKRF